MLCSDAEAQCQSAAVLVGMMIEVDLSGELRAPYLEQILKIVA
jgi:hypothetical protein